ncbi:serpin family protein [Streptomyces goshikiensis]|uniref:serpin family protein n=1 Tax=Streptomyces goshikiensis TaxID=1942 RepID=UPI0036CF9EF7
MGLATTTVQAVNRLTARWADASEGGTAFSAAGVWPLLAHLADGAQGVARAQLEEALGLPAGQAMAAARELLAAMDAMRGLETGLGLWTRRTLELRNEWEAGLPADAHGVLTGDPAADRQALDAWTAKRTGGLIDRMPVTLTEDTQMVLASALTMRTQWLRPFDEVELATAYEPWATQPWLGLRRSSTVLDRVGVAQTPGGYVTELKVLGNNALDVHLLLGEEGMSPGQVLGAGVGLLADRYAVLPGPRLPFGNAGPGLRVEKVRCTRPELPSLEVTTVAYDVNASHDLLQLHRLFGLTAVRDTSHGHFPGISDFPLAIGSAEQNVRAKFGALGFEAAAVTAFGAVGAGIPDLRYVTTMISAAFDRPFGFLALHRHTRLVLTAGWVTDPLPPPELDWDDELDRDDER